jgi:predicted nuclease of predicted toxin-antitoxin system
VVDIYLDHNVSLRLGSMLQQFGHDVVATRDRWTGRLTDDALLLDAVQSHRMLITHNRRDFVLLHDAWQSWPAAFGTRLPEHPGILVLDAASEQQLARVISDVLNAAPMSRQLFWWRRTRGWQRRLPRGEWEPM